MVEYTRTFAMVATVIALGACAQDPQIQPLTKGFVVGRFS